MKRLAKLAITSVVIVAFLVAGVLGGEDLLRQHYLEAHNKDLDESVLHCETARQTARSVPARENLTLTYDRTFAAWNDADAVGMLLDERQWDEIHIDVRSDAAGAATYRITATCEVHHA